jgi:virginiamycin B lyase
MRAWLILAAMLGSTLNSVADERVTYYPLPKASGYPHDVAAAPDGMVWYSAQGSGHLGILDPKTAKVELVALGKGSSPHGVIVGPDGAAWLTDGGQNAIVRVDPATRAVKVFPLPKEFPNANLNTGVFDKSGIHWFTGQGGMYGRLDPKTGKVEAWKAPREGVGPRRVWSDSKGILWVSFWHSGEVGRYDPAAKTWKTWALPKSGSGCYSVYVDDQDKVWLTDFIANAIVRFDPVAEKFESFPSNRRGASIRQMHGRPSEVWGAESGTSRLVRVTY